MLRILFQPSQPRVLLQLLDRRDNRIATRPVATILEQALKHVVNFKRVELIELNVLATEVAEHVVVDLTGAPCGFDIAGQRLRSHTADLNDIVLLFHIHDTQ